MLQFVGVRSVFNSLNFFVLGIALLKGGRIHVFEIWVHMSQAYNMILRTQSNICIVQILGPSLICAIHVSIYYLNYIYA